MAELILTEAEQNAALWSDLDDAALGKMLRKKIHVLQNAADQMNKSFTSAAALLFICAAAETNSNSISMRIEGVTQNGREFGDWVVSAVRIV